MYSLYSDSGMAQRCSSIDLGKNETIPVAVIASSVLNTYDAVKKNNL